MISTIYTDIVLPQSVKDNTTLVSILASVTWKFDDTKICQCPVSHILDYVHLSHNITIQTASCFVLFVDFGFGTFVSRTLMHGP